MTLETMGQILEEGMDGFRMEELECKICFSFYTLGRRRPKVLDCCHRLCAKCLTKMVQAAEAPARSVQCPFCRYPTTLPPVANVSSLPDDCNIVAALTILRRDRMHLKESSTTEVLLSPGRLGSVVNGNPSRASSSFLVITMMENSQEPVSSQNRPQAPVTDYSSGLDSAVPGYRCWSPRNCADFVYQCWTTVLLCVFWLFFFSSLPLGVYLLTSKQTTLGVFLVCFMPLTMVILAMYSLCMRFYHKLCDCISG